MINLNYTTKYEGEIKTLKLKRNPLRHGLGNYEDVDGNMWDVECIVGGKKPYINARMITLNNPYYSTAAGAHSYGHHVWNPYYFELLKN